VTEYAKASDQKEVGVSLGTNGNKGRQLHGHKCAWRIKPFSKHTSNKLKEGLEDSGDKPLLQVCGIQEDQD
jgi:hypothetical protein